MRQYIERREACNIHNMLTIEQQNDILHQEQCLLALFSTVIKRIIIYCVKKHTDRIACCVLK